MKFDPTSRSLKNRSEGINVRIGSGEVNKSELVFLELTNAPVLLKKNRGIADGLQTTGILDSSNPWQLPAITSYIEIEDYNELQSVELAAYETSKQFSW